MNTQQYPPIDRDTAERLLDGDRATSAPEARLLLSLLRAAEAPARPRELAGEDAALAEFRATLGAAAPTPAASRIKTSVLKLFTVKMAVLAATATGGVAIAAGTGALPLPGVKDRITQSPPAPPAPNDSPGEDETGGGPTGPGTLPRNAPTPSPPGVHGPSPGSLVGHCRAYTAKRSAQQREKLLDRPAFAGLIQAAGGREHVAAYCDGLLADLTPDGDRKEPRKPDKKDRSRRPGERGGAGEGAQQ